MKRIAVIGCCGAGKSYLSMQLSEKLDIPVYHLDKMFWDTNWVEQDNTVFLAEQKETVRGERWIIDGNYTSSMAIRLDRADTVIFLDFPTYLSLYGIFRRYLKYRNSTRPDMTEGNPEKIDFEFFWFVFTFRMKKRKRILNVLKNYSASTEQYIFKNRKQVERFFQAIQIESA